MIGVDTNVLVRFFVHDEPSQTVVAERFISERTEAEPAFVSAVVLAELVWVLDRAYGYPDAAIHSAIDGLFESANIVVERTDMMSLAVAAAREAKADISDAIIAALAADAGASRIVTFDKDAAKKITGMELLA